MSNLHDSVTEQLRLSIYLANLMLELGGVRVMMFNRAIKEDGTQAVMLWDEEEFSQYAFDRLVDDLKRLSIEQLNKDVDRLTSFHCLGSVDPSSPPKGGEDD